MELQEAKAIKIPSIFKPCFENVPGMDSLKRALTNMYNMQQINKKRINLGVGGSGSSYKNNILILGPRGSGKTSAADIVGECYEKLGIITDRDPIATDYQALLSTSAAETAKNVKELVESAVNRIILFDNIEEFDDGMPYSPGLEMIDQIVEAYYASNGTITILATGEEEAVKELLHKKRNFAELFDIPTVILGEYSKDDLIRVAHKIAEGMGYILDSDADSILLKRYNDQQGTPDFNYLNMFKDMIVAASLNAASRVASIRHATDLDVSLIKAEDFRSINSNLDGMESLEELMDQLNGLIGLTGVKEQVDSLIASVKMAHLEAEAGINTSKGTLHMVFSGSPGTGKTTVARIIGKIYARLGVLSKGQMIECSRADLVSDVVGGTAKQTHAKVEEARGGVLFIDEAYSVCRDKYDSFGIEAIDTLTADIYNYRDDLLVILAGYDKEMDEFMSKNPGMKSRVPHTIHFDDYTPDELMQIFKKYVDDSGMVIDPDAEGEIKEVLDEKSKAPEFGNARGVENIFNDIVRNHQKRLSSLTEEFISADDIKTIVYEDIRTASESELKRNTVQEWYDELDSLTGLQSVKDQVKQMAAKVKVNQMRKERGLPVQGMPSLHMVFKGNAGTGKTTVARLIGNIYKGLGVLSTGKLVECTRSDIVGEYQGQTAQKMKAKIKESYGGILFIDEVYSLCNGPYDSYGMEAINELVPAMENQRDNFMVIVAGYTKQMEDFLNSNQGLKSRFSTELIFEDFSKEELVQIFEDMLDGRSLTLSAEEDMPKLIESLIIMCSMKQDFGNARGVRNLVEKLSQIQESRIAGMLEQGIEITDDEIQQISKADIESLVKHI